MSRRTAAPFNRLHAAVATRPWMITVGAGPPAPLGEITPDWDYASAVSLERVILLDHQQAADELGLGEDPFDLEVLIEVGTGPGDLPRELVLQTRLPLEAGEPCTISLSVDPSRLSAQLTLRTSVLLVSTSDPADPLAPRRAASRLWEERCATRIEGDDPRFPMEVVSFSTVFAGRPHEAAPWLLSWSPASPGRDFHGAARLYLNADEEDFVERVQEEDELTLQAMMGDVVSQMCETALRAGWDEDFDSAEPASVAGRVAHWLGQAFSDVTAAKAALENRPGEFRSAILASVRL
ncbi:MAG: hypothetical protein QME55_00080 [Brevundimonas sp.]|uniref:hypothetical protein n=3 Tax=Brevundimonas sp. TaxID=1871086 RepID=UPI00260A87AF|nr:hypothetical protein [Brevundimonas sp.]MDI6623100.1 hypothetical protein [Brevundimonas sp.]